ncbi:MAG: glutaminyl-peptide cyclotransferase [Prevotellaceae bacterium]|jgi:glutamine cyclotransferase|nr:glutaminyl-peptide cyclotransferase [Prevotellaceae bacterium]
MAKLVKKGHIRLFLFLFLSAVAGCKSSNGQITNYSYRVVAAYPHDAQAYTQGLFIHNGAMYESTGQYGQSSLRKVDIKTGRVLNMIPLPKHYFGEGSCVWNNKIYLLTYMEQTVFVYDLSFKQTGEFHYPGEGWGLTTDGTHLIMSNGSSILRFINPENFTEVRTLEVTFQGRALPMLNELEYINGEIWANVYMENHLVRIDPVNGKVTGVLFLNNLLPASLRTRNTDVLNGIAYDAAASKLYVTGKNWPKLYEITTQPTPGKR